MRNLYLDADLLDKEDIKEYLKENLGISIKTVLEKGYCTSDKVFKLKIELVLEDEIICSDTAEIRDIVYPRNLEYIISDIVNIIEKIPYKNEESENVIKKLQKIEYAYDDTMLELTGELWYNTYNILKKFLLDDDGYLYPDKLDYGILILCKFFELGKNPIKSRFKRKK